MASAGSIIGEGGRAGTVVRGGQTALLVTEILWESTIVADAFVDPSDAPSTDTMRIQKDAGGAIALYFFNVTNAQWRAVELL